MSRSYPAPVRAESRTFRGNLTGSLLFYAQEKPDFEEQPDRAPDGIEGRAEPMRKLDDEMVFLTSRLLHSGHLTVSVVFEDVVRTSKCFLQSLQTYS